MAMQEKEFYQQILGLESPWYVSDVKLDMEAQQVDVYVEHPEATKFCCPDCSQALSCYDHASPRTWRHLDTMQFKTLLHAAVPRVECPEHGVKQVKVPWAEPRSRFTLLFERLAIDVLLSTQNVKSAQAILRTGWEQTWNIVLRAVRRGQLRKEQLPIRHLGIDEKSFTKGQSYLTLLYDLDRSTVEAISEGHDTAAADACFSRLSPAQLDSVEAIAMDMSAAYVRSAKANLPLGEEKIVHDRFHVMKLATEAVDKVRRQEHRRLKSEDDSRLTGTKFLWIKSQENLTDKQRIIFDEVFSSQLATGKAWAYKEMLRELWQHDSPSAATDYFNDWYRSVIHTKLEPMKKVARTIKERLANVVSYCKHGITNAVAEGINSKIQSVKRRVGGYRNKENYMTAIYFYCGGLDLHPH
jgi:transposase